MHNSDDLLIIEFVQRQMVITSEAHVAGRISVQ